MADSYLSMSQIAGDQFMNDRIRSAAAQQGAASPVEWTNENRYQWAASPGWGEKWTYALNTHPDDPDYQPGRDEAVITDGDILATVQALVGAGGE